MSLPHPDQVLSTYVIYYKPLDYPEGYVIRRFELRDGQSIPTEDASYGQTLAEIRAHVPFGLVVLPHLPEDHPSVVEVWI